LSVIC